MQNPVYSALFIKTPSIVKKYGFFPKTYLLVITVGYAAILARTGRKKPHAFHTYIDEQVVFIINQSSFNPNIHFKNVWMISYEVGHAPPSEISYLGIRLTMETCHHTCSASLLPPCLWPWSTSCPKRGKVEKAWIRLSCTWAALVDFFWGRSKMATLSMKSCYI